MKKAFFPLLLLLVVVVGHAQKMRVSAYAAGFYNLENLFDTIHDEGKNDQDFLPDGSYVWDSEKYQNKLRNMAQVLAEMGTDHLASGCAFIGVAEVENERVLADLVKQSPLKKRGFKYCHIEGPDKRGIDCALLYNPKLFKVTSVELPLYKYVKPEDSDRDTRGFLTVKGKLAGEDVCVIVCHWPSRGAASFYREEGGRQVRILKDSLLQEKPNLKLFIMGDMNDDPTNNSMVKALGCSSDIDHTADGMMFNPWYNVLTVKSRGTLCYRDTWNLFDQIVMSPNLLNKSGDVDYSTLKYAGAHIFTRDYLFQTEGKYKGYPKRTTAGKQWLNGYSDHLPVVVYLVKH